jgi:colanic acid biosynthesis glycosyl transferase WcaI
MESPRSRAPSMIILTQYYPPEPGAASLRLQAMAQEVARAGWTVKVVTAFPHHLGYRNVHYRGRLIRHEQDGPVAVVRTWVWAVPTGRFWRRLLNYFSFVVTSLAGLFRQGPADYLLVESPPLFLGLSAWLYGVLTGTPYILSVSDLWPDSAVALGLVSNPILIGWARRLEHFLYRHAYRVSAVTEGIRDSILATGLVAREHMLFAPNGVYPERYQRREPDPEIRRRLGLGDRRVFLYPGTIGYAQGLEVVLDAASILKDQGLGDDVAFLLVGDGPVKAELAAEAKRRGLERLVVFEDLQPADRMPLYFSLARAVVVPLRKHKLFAGARPSKAFPAWASGVPVIFSGEGEMARVVEASGAGLTVPPGDGPALAMAVDLFRRMSPEEIAAIGRLGRAFVEREYAWPSIVERWMKGLRPA